MAERPCPVADLTVGTQPSQESLASGRGDHGRFAPGNTAALRHGAFSQQVAAGGLAEQAEAVAAATERRAEIVRDLGEELSALAVGQVDAYVRLEIVSDFLWSNLVDQGVLTGKGRQRAALSAWLQVVDRQHRLAVALGLERRAKRAPQIEDYLREGRGAL